MCIARLKGASGASAALISRLVRQTGWAEGLALAVRQLRQLDEAFLASPQTRLQRLQVLSAAMSAISQSAAWNKALALLWHEHHDCRVQRVQPDLFIYNATAAACGRASRWQWALHLLEHTRLVRLEVDSTSLNILISACGRAFEWKLALAFATGACKLKGQVQPNVFGEAKGIGAALHALGQTGHFRLALALLHEMQSRQASLSIGCFNAVISASVRSGHWVHAAQCLQSIGQLRLVPTLITRSAVICLFGRAGLWQLSLAALGIFHSSASEPFKGPARSINMEANLTVLNSSLSACGRAARWELADFLLEAMPSMGLVADSLSVAAVVSAYAAVWRWEHALKLCLKAPNTSSIALQAAAASMHSMHKSQARYLTQRWLLRLTTKLKYRKPVAEEEFGAALLASDLFSQSYELQSFTRLHHRRVATPPSQCLQKLRTNQHFAKDSRQTRRTFDLLELVYDLGPELSKIALEMNAAKRSLRFTGKMKVRPHPYVKHLA